MTYITIMFNKKQDGHWYGIIAFALLSFLPFSFQDDKLSEIEPQKTSLHASSVHSLTNEKASSVLSEQSFLHDDDFLFHHPKSYSRSEAAAFALLSACLVGFSGVVPLLILPSFKHSELKEKKNASKLKRLLSFAVGGLLGDVFLHLLPESWEHLQKVSKDGVISHWASTVNGLWILVGLISFCLLEKLFPDQLIETSDEIKTEQACYSKLPDLTIAENNNNYDKSYLNGVKPCVSNGCIPNKNSNVKSPNPPRIKTSGYLNLLANCIDNFTHGLAVGGSYMVSTRVGLLTTLAILLHEIPHEVGDFAILLRAGFTRFQAVKLQLLTASGGIIGAITAFLFESMQTTGEQVAWILPFTSGGFIYVALCTVVPDILQETSPKESLIQLFYLLLAIAVMHGVSYIG